MNETKQNKSVKEEVRDCKICNMLGQCGCATKAVVVVVISVLLSVLTTSLVGQGNKGQVSDETIKTWVKNNPAVILDAVNEHFATEQRKAREESLAKGKEGIKQNRDQLERNSSDPVVNKKGKVTIVEFFDYNCGYCRAANDSLKELLKNNKNARIVHKQFPILSEDSDTAARYALAVYYAEPAKYLKFHNAIFASRSKNATALSALAQENGIDTAKLNKSLKDNKKKIDDVLAENRRLAMELGIQGTPAFVIGDELIPGMVDGATLEQLVNQAAK